MMISSLRYVCLISLFIFSSISFSAASAGFKDLSNLSEKDGSTYEIGFCARPSPGTVKNLPGHAFVSFSHKVDGKRSFLAIGHTVQAGTSPEKAALSYVGDPVDGYLKEENSTSSMPSCLIVKVNKADYEAAFNLTKNPLDQIGIFTSKTFIVLQTYKLGSDDCMNFMINVAKTLEPKGLKVPKRHDTEFPMNYMIRFIDLNLKDIPTTPKIRIIQ